MALTEVYYRCERCQSTTIHYCTANVEPAPIPEPKKDTAVMTNQRWILLTVATLLATQIIALIGRALTHSFFPHELLAWQITGVVSVGIAIVLFVWLPYHLEHRK